MEYKKEIRHHLILDNDEAEQLQYILMHPSIFQIRAGDDPPEQSFYPELREQIGLTLRVYLEQTTH